jgi:hypothetical protein
VLKHSEKLEGPPNEGGPTLTPRYGSTSHSVMIAAPGRLRVVLGAGHSLLIGGVRRSRPTPLAPPKAGVAGQCDWQHAGGEEYAKRQHHPKPVEIHRYVPLSTIPPTNSDVLGRSHFHQAREIGRPTTGIDRQTRARQPRRDAR